MTTKQDLKDIKKYAFEAEQRIGEYRKKIEKEVEDKAQTKMNNEGAFGIEDYENLSIQKMFDIVMASDQVAILVEEYAYEEIRTFINLYTASVIESNPEIRNFSKIVETRNIENGEPIILINALWNSFKHNLNTKTDIVRDILKELSFWEYISNQSELLESLVKHPPGISLHNSLRII